MTQIKTYQQVNRKDTSMNFEITKMETSYENRKGNIGPPHRHDFYTILLISKAKGQHIIDFNAFEMIDNQVYFLSPGQVHQVIEKEKSNGYVLTFSNQFLINNNIPISFIQDMNMFNNFGYAPPLSINTESVDKLASYCDEILQFHNSEMKHKYQAIGSSLKLFLIHCNNQCTKPIDNTQYIHTGYHLLKSFKDAVDDHYIEWHGTAQYADHLSISPDHLNRTVKSLIGKTAKEYIQSRITIAAKRLLYFSELSTKEIGYALGFSEASNFSTFFKKCAKVSPTEFRKNK